MRPLMKTTGAGKILLNLIIRVFTLAPEYIVETILKNNGSLIKKAYKDSIQLPVEGKDGGYVEFEYIPEDTESEDEPYDRSIQSVIRNRT